MKPIENIFEYNGYTYNIIDSIDINDHHMMSFNILTTDKTIIKTIFPMCPIIKNGKFRWFRKTKVKYVLKFWRALEFDDGLSYRFFWSKWKHDWVLKEIIS